MKSITLLASVFSALLCAANPSGVLTQQIRVEGSSPATLYSVIKYRGENRKGCLSLLTGVTYSSTGRNPCDLYYGMLYAGNEKDWFQSSTAVGNRSVIKDLGELDWTATFKVPLVAPLPKLGPGEKRVLSVDTSGADGADGAPGRPGVRGANGADADRAQIFRPQDPSAAAPIPAAIARPKHDGKVKVSSLWVKAVPGHLYVIHVVDDAADYYALFRVEALESGDSCTITWRLISAPEAESAGRK